MAVKMGFGKPRRHMNKKGKQLIAAMANKSPVFLALQVLVLFFVSKVSVLFNTPIFLMVGGLIYI